MGRVKQAEANLGGLHVKGMEDVDGLQSIAYVYRHGPTRTLLSRAHSGRGDQIRRMKDQAKRPTGMDQRVQARAAPVSDATTVGLVLWAVYAVHTIGSPWYQAYQKLKGCLVVLFLYAQDSFPSQLPPTCSYLIPLCLPSLVT